VAARILCRADDHVSIQPVGEHLASRHGHQHVPTVVLGAPMEAGNPG
jgi:hypothetical protein